MPTPLTILTTKSINNLRRITRDFNSNLKSKKLWLKKGEKQLSVSAKHPTGYNRRLEFINLHSSKMVSHSLTLPTCQGFKKEKGRGGRPRKTPTYKALAAPKNQQDSDNDTASHAAVLSTAFP